jgi:GR25 family glycosyltransferase involved in LPS biosynthesis
MTPSEVGCELWHLAINPYSGAEAAIIFEDDVLLDDLSMQPLDGVLEGGLYKRGYLSLGVWTA